MRRLQLPSLVEVDLLKPEGAVSLGPRIVSEIARGVTILQRLEAGGIPDRLSRFREEFEQRYGTREVPLVEALDEEHGIGFESFRSPRGAASLLASVAFPDGSESDGDEVAEWTARDAFLLEKLLEVTRDDSVELRLSSSDLEHLSARRPDPLPDAFHAMVAVATASDEAADRGEFRVHLKHVRGPSGATYLGRLCHADTSLRDRIQGHLRAEEQHRPDAVFAEVVHFPGGRVSNLRPVLRGYEIPYLGRSGAPSSRQIPVTDLHLSMNEGRVVLRSRRLDREVIPRLTSAHNHSQRSVRMYRFLCALGGSGGVVATGMGLGAVVRRPVPAEGHHGEDRPRPGAMESDRRRATAAGQDQRGPGAIRCGPGVAGAAEPAPLRGPGRRRSRAGARPRQHPLRSGIGRPGAQEPDLRPRRAVPGPR